jgi:hypothetical protein
MRKVITLGDLTGFPAGALGVWFAQAWKAGHHREAGYLKWEEEINPNKIVFEGLNDCLSVYFASGSQTLSASWFLGATQASPVFADSDTMASHAGWTEFTAVSDANRLAWGQGSPANQQVTNASPVTYTCNADGQTMGGLFCTTNNVLGGASGILFNGGAFNGSNRGLNTGETIDITSTIAFTSLS